MKDTGKLFFSCFNVKVDFSRLNEVLSSNLNVAKGADLKDKAYLCRVCIWIERAKIMLTLTKRIADIIIMYCYFLRGLSTK